MPYRPLALALTLALAGTPAIPWEFSPSPVCTLTYQSPQATTVITKDLSLPEPYTIAITTPAPWPAAPGFTIEYEGPAPLTIGTDRHILSQNGQTLSVSDAGFGNVLAGIAFNTTAIATSGSKSVAMDLTGAAPQVAAFRACPTAATS